MELAARPGTDIAFPGAALREEQHRLVPPPPEHPVGRGGVRCGERGAELVDKVI